MTTPEEITTSLTMINEVKDEIKSIINPVKSESTVDEPFFPNKMEHGKYTFFVSQAYDREALSVYFSININKLRPFEEGKEIIFDICEHHIISSKHKVCDNMAIGIGNYIFKYNDTDVIIEVSEIGPPVDSCRGIIIPRKMILKCESCQVIDKLMSEVKEVFKRTHRSTDTMTIYVPNKYGEWITYGKIPPRKLDTIYVDDSVKYGLLNDITHFLKSEDEYNTFGIPHKKNYLLTGIPGSGKTSLVKAICNEIKHNIAILAVNHDMDNSTLTCLFAGMHSETVLLIEDIDCLFHQRDASKSSMFNFSNLLNVLDGVLYRSGLITIITTNHPELLDSAIMRQGRMDMVFQINYPKKKDIMKMFCVMFEKKYVTDDEMATEFARFYNYIQGKKIPMSAIVNFLFRHRDKYEDHISTFLDTDSFLKEVTFTDTKLYG